MVSTEMTLHIILETRDQHLSLSPLVFYANTRSVKGKSTELTALAQDCQTICFTETHVDHTIANKQMLDHDDLIFYRKGMRIHGGGVFIGVSNTMDSKRVNMPVNNNETLFVEINHKLIECYYRTHVNDPTQSFIISTTYIFSHFPKHQIYILET